MPERSLAAPALAPNVFIGRQPIYDRELRVIGYELLYRGGEGNRAGEIDGDRATSQVLVNAFLEIGLERLVGDRLAFINLTRAFLTAFPELGLPRERVVLEVLEDIEVDEEVVAAVRGLSRKGYRIALDDFIFHERLRPLVDLADIIKIDVLALSAEALAEHVARLRHPRRRLLAEKVEDQAMFRRCRELGFDYFQGYFFCRPEVVKGRRPPPNRMAVLRLLAELQDPRTTAERLEALVGADAALGYRLVRLVNSPWFGLRTRVDSLRRAIVVLGTRQLRALASVLAMARIEGKPSELMTLALVRARMCELLAARSGRADPQAAFTAGLFSVLDALLDQPMDELLEELPLADEVAAALARREGPVGAILDCVLRYEHAEWERACCPGLRPEAVRDAYLEALDWAREVQRAVGVA